MLERRWDAEYSGQWSQDEQSASRWYDSLSSGAVTQQFVWSGADELAYLQTDYNGNGRFTNEGGTPGITPGSSPDLRLESLTDRNKSPIAFKRDKASDNHPIVERVRYGGYGLPRPDVTMVHGGIVQGTHGGDADGDSDCDFADLNIVLSAFGQGGLTLQLGDLNDTNTADAADLDVVLANIATGTDPGEYWPEGTLSRLDNIVGYGGYIWDEAAQLYLCRHRWLDPRLGRWITRDPAGYVDGLNVYQYVRGNPWGATDPLGLRGNPDVNSQDGGAQLGRHLASSTSESGSLCSGGPTFFQWLRGKATRVFAGAATGGATGALVGAGTGAVVGAFAGGAGAIPGAGVGAAAGGLGGAISGAIDGLLADWDAPVEDVMKQAAISGGIDGLTGGFGSKFVKGGRVVNAGIDLLNKSPTGTARTVMTRSAVDLSPLAPRPSPAVDAAAWSCDASVVARVKPDSLPSPCVDSAAQASRSMGPNGTLPELRISRTKHPELADNIFNAQSAGHPSVLTHGGVSKTNRTAALNDVPSIHPLSRDEYPFASSLEGGAGAWVGHIPLHQQHAQGGIIAHFLRVNSMQPGDRYLVVVEP